jgi:hypothetical protein
MQTMGHVELMHGWCAPWNEAAFIAALTEGGDSRSGRPRDWDKQVFHPPCPDRWRRLLQRLHRLTDLRSRLSAGDALLRRPGNRALAR